MKFRPSVFSLAFFLLASVTFAQDAQRSAISFTEQEKIVEQSLIMPANINFVDAELSELADKMRDDHGIHVRFHESAIDIGLAPDEIATFQFQEVPLASALDIFLEPYASTYAIQGNCLVILTKEAAQNHQRLKVYDCRKLLAKIESPNSSANQLVELIEGSITPQGWKNSGGHGTIFELNGLLVVAQTEDAHRQIGDLLGTLAELIVSDSKSN